MDQTGFAHAATATRHWLADEQLRRSRLLSIRLSPAPLPQFAVNAVVVARKPA